jgi:hypothetical protein
MKLRSANINTVRDAKAALSHLRAALVYATDADCPKTAARIRLAITSAGGAVRHAERRAWAAELQRAWAAECATRAHQPSLASFQRVSP